MSTGTLESSALTDRMRLIQASVDTPALVSPERMSSLILAPGDLLRIARRLSIEATSAENPKIRQVHYGSPLEIVLAVSAASSAAAGTLLICAKILTQFATYFKTLAEARKVTAETDHIRISQAKTRSSSNWRTRHLVGIESEIKRPQRAKNRLSTEYYEIDALSDLVIALSAQELEDLYIAQANEIAERLLTELRRELDPQLTNRVELTSRELRSLLLLTEYRTRLRLVEEEEESVKPSV